jgi:hypothetical protein
MLDKCPVREKPKHLETFALVRSARRHAIALFLPLPRIDSPCDVVDVRTNASRRMISRADGSIAEHNSVSVGARMGYGFDEGMNTRQLRLILVISILTACGKPDQRAEQLRALITRELPVGTSATRVIAFLDDRHIEHSDYTKPPGPAEVTAIVREPSWWRIVKTSHRIVFSFDHGSRLTRYRLEEAYTGP